jgi:hypothetical protein
MATSPIAKQSSMSISGVMASLLENRNYFPSDIHINIHTMLFIKTFALIVLK